MKFNAYIQQSLPNLIEFKDIIIKVRDRYPSDINRDLHVFELFSLFEKNNLKCRAKDSRLFFINNGLTKETQSINSMNILQTSPYDLLYENISADILNLEAFQEALNGIISLQNIFNNTQMQFEEKSSSIEKVKNGAINIEQLFTFKTKDEFIPSKIKEQEKIQNSINNLITVISMVTFQMDKEINVYTKTSIEEYYKELNNIKKKINNLNDINVKFYNQILKGK